MFFNRDAKNKALFDKFAPLAEEALLLLDTTAFAHARGDRAAASAQLPKLKATATRIRGEFDVLSRRVLECRDRSVALDLGRVLMDISELIQRLDTFVYALEDKSQRENFTDKVGNNAAADSLDRGKLIASLSGVLIQTQYSDWETAMPEGQLNDLVAAFFAGAQHMWEQLVYLGEKPTERYARSGQKLVADFHANGNGALVAAGYVDFMQAHHDPRWHESLPKQQQDEMSRAYNGGAHLLAEAIVRLRILDLESQPPERVLRRMDLITRELRDFSKAVRRG